MFVTFRTQKKRRLCKRSEPSVPKTFTKRTNKNELQLYSTYLLTSGLREKKIKKPSEESPAVNQSPPKVPPQTESWMRPLLRGPNWWVLPTSCEGFCFLRAGLRHQIDFRTLQLGVVADYTPDPASLSFSVSTPPKKSATNNTKTKTRYTLTTTMQKLSGASFSSLLRQWLFWGGRISWQACRQDVEISSKKTCFFETPGKSARSFAILAAWWGGDSAERWHVPKRCWWSFFWEDQGDLGWSKFQVFRLGAPLWAMWSPIISCKFDGMATGNTVFPKVWPMKVVLRITPSLPESPRTSH